MATIDTDPSVRIAENGESTLEILPYDQMYTEYYPALLRKAMSSGLNMQDAEDAVQLTFTRAYLKFDTFVPQAENAQRKWLFTILRNVIIDEGRRITRTKLDYSPDMLDYMEHPDLLEDNSFHDIEYDELLAHINRVLAPQETGRWSSQGKKANWPQYLIRSIVDGDHYSEIANDFGVPRGSVQSGIFRACKALANDSEFAAALGVKIVESRAQEPILEQEEE